MYSKRTEKESTGGGGFPRWVAPIIGAILGAIYGLRGMKRAGLQDAMYPVWGAVAGTMGGGFLWLLHGEKGSHRPPSGSGKLLAILSVVPGLVPVAGLLFGVPAFIVNRRVAGWPNGTSRMGLGLCLVISAIVIGAFLIPLG